LGPTPPPEKNSPPGHPRNFEFFFVKKKKRSNLGPAGLFVVLVFFFFFPRPKIRPPPLGGGPRPPWGGVGGGTVFFFFWNPIRGCFPPPPENFGFPSEPVFGGGGAPLCSGKNQVPPWVRGEKHVFFGFWGLAERTKCGDLRPAPPPPAQTVIRGLKTKTKQSSPPGPPPPPLAGGGGEKSPLSGYIPFWIVEGKKNLVPHTPPWGVQAPQEKETPSPPRDGGTPWPPPRQNELEPPPQKQTQTLPARAPGKRPGWGGYKTPVCWGGRKT